MATSKAELQARKERKSEMSQLAGRLAKTANQRLRSLEKAGLQNASNAYRYIEKLHFDKDSATATDAQGRMKFNTNFRGLTYQEVQHRIGEITRFLEAQTSTVSGVNAKYKKGFVTYRERYGADISYAEFTDLMRNDTMKRLKSQFSSAVINRIIDHMKATGETVKQAMDRFKDVDIENSDMSEFEEILDENTPWGENVTEQEDIT